MMIYHEKRAIILADEQEYCIAMVAKTIAELMDFEGSVEFDTSMSDGQPRKTVSTSKLKTYLRNYKFVSLREGLEDTVEWFGKNQSVIRA